MTAKQARFQIVDVIASMRPLTKMTRQIVSPGSIPAIVRDAFRVAMEERPGLVHLELPEDVAGEETENVPLISPHPIELPVAPPPALDRAAKMILKAQRPLIMLGAGSSRPKLVEPLSSFVRRTRHSFFNTQMGKGSVTGGSNSTWEPLRFPRATTFTEQHRPGNPADQSQHHRRDRQAAGPPHLRRDRRHPPQRPAQRRRPALQPHHGAAGHPHLPATQPPPAAADAGLIPLDQMAALLGVSTPPSKSGTTPELSAGSGITTKAKSSTTRPDPTRQPATKDAWHDTVRPA